MDAGYSAELRLGKIHRGLAQDLIRLAQLPILRSYVAQDCAVSTRISATRSGLSIIIE